jgi:hypothetical protein
MPPRVRKRMETPRTKNTCPCKRAQATSCDARNSRSQTTYANLSFIFFYFIIAASAGSSKHIRAKG